MFGVSMQAGIFQSGIGEGRTANLDISGNDLDAIVKAAGVMFGKTRQTIQGAQVRPLPSIEMTYPEVNFKPNRDSLKANSMTAGELGIAIDVIMDGRIVGDYKPEGKKKIDLVIKTNDNEVSTPEDLYQSFSARIACRLYACGRTDYRCPRCKSNCQHRQNYNHVQKRSQ